MHKDSLCKAFDVVFIVCYESLCKVGNKVLMVKVLV